MRKLYILTVFVLLFSSASLIGMYFLFDIEGRREYECLTQLHHAATNGDLEVAQEILSGGSNAEEVNFQDFSGLTPLHRAVVKGHDQIVEFLIRVPEIDVNIQDPKQGCTALHFAVEYGFEKIVDQLLCADAVTIIQNFEGLTPLDVARQKDFSSIAQRILEEENKLPLHQAATNGNCAAVIELLKAGADVNAKDKKGLTSLHRATLRGHEEVVKILLNTSEIDLNIQEKNGYTPLDLAIFAEEKTVIKMLLNTQQISINEDVLCAISRKIGFANVGKLIQNEIYKFLIKSSQNQVQETGEHLQHLHKAVFERDIEKVKKLLRLGGNINADQNGLTPLHFAMVTRSEPMVKFLLEITGIDVNAQDMRGLTPLHHAVLSFDQPIVETLLKTRGIDVNIKIRGDNNKRLTPLHLAIAGNPFTSNDRELHYPASSARLLLDKIHKHCMVKTLLNHPETDINAGDRDKYSKEGHTPLHYAIIIGDAELVKILLTAPKIDVNARADVMPLGLAVKIGDEQIFHMLLSFPGVDVNAQDGYGKTPLHTAIETGNGYIIKMLLDVPGIDVKVQDKEGMTPLHIALVCNAMNKLSRVYRIAKDYKKVIQNLLLLDGIDVNIKEENGNTLLSLISEHIKELIEEQRQDRSSLLRMLVPNLRDLLVLFMMGSMYKK